MQANNKHLAKTQIMKRYISESVEGIKENEIKDPFSCSQAGVTPVSTLRAVLHQSWPLA